MAMEAYSIWCSDPDCRFHMNGTLDKVKSIRKWNHRPAIDRLTKERDEARASAKAAYERAAHLIECDGDALGGKNGAAKAIRALATKAETNTLAEIVKKAVDKETRACAEVVSERRQGWLRPYILARLDQPKGGDKK